MKYVGEFRDIKNTPYKVEIITNGDSADTINLVLADQPFVTTLEGSDNLFKEVKLAGATIRLVSDNYHFDLYASTAMQNKVTLYKNNAIEWVGYITSNLYNMGYENDKEIIEIEAIDGLSVLQYYDYNANPKSIVSFIDIINKALSKSGLYSEYYISNNYHTNEYVSDCLPQRFNITEQNFFDEDNEAMNYLEVLEEVCKYLNVVCVADKGKVYFLDYEAMVNGNNEYYKFQVGSNSYSKVILEKNNDINGRDYAENGGQISLDNVYNKITVKDSLYSFDSVIPSVWDDDLLTNYNGQGNIQTVDENGKGGKHKCYFKYYKHKNYKTFYYTKEGQYPIGDPSTVNYKFTQDYIGATICKACFDKVKSFDVKKNDINFTNYILLACHDKNPLDSTIKRPMFSTIVDKSIPSFIGGNTYLIIKGNALWMDRENEMYIMQGYMNKDDDFNVKSLFIYARLQYGDMYWDGNNWSNTPCDFELHFQDSGTGHAINQNFPVKNNIDWTMGLEGEDGYAIPMPSQAYAVVGKPIFTLYQPARLNKDYRCDAVWLSNFDIIAKVVNHDTDRKENSDTEYSNVINQEFVNEFKDVEFKICTWDNKEPNYSAVCYKNDNGTYQYVDKIYNVTTNQYIRPEEHYIYKIVRQYSSPSTILELNLQDKFNIFNIITDKYLNGRLFVIDEYSKDYEYNKNTVKLVEKK